MAAVSALAAVVVGLGTWSLVEYVLHRWGFHHSRQDRLTSLIAAEHRQHHRDPLRTSAAMRALAWVAVVLAASPVLLLDGIGWGTTVPIGLLVGWALGYSAYDQFHWRAHHRNATSRYETWVRARHTAHHYGQLRKNYGVTSDVWDRVFGTRASA